MYFYRMILLTTLVVAILFPLSVFAGEYLVNDTGVTVYGLRVSFTDQVRITEFGDILTTVEPTGKSAEFTFYGKPLAPWKSHWFSWKPTSTEVLETEWLLEAPTNLGNKASPPKSKVEINGKLLNPKYFAHPAYLMQGVSNREQVFAMPLDGIPELDFYPLCNEALLDRASWAIQVDDPEMVQAIIEGGVLYIWAKADSDTGATSVTLTAKLPSGETSQAIIPVIVFRKDKTITWFSGEKDYFIPWDSQLDINRRKSVRGHAEKYGFEDLSRLDSTICFSKWRPMPKLCDVEKSLFWDNELVTEGFWPKAAQLRLTTVFLTEIAEIGANAIRVPTTKYIKGKTGTEIYPVYERRLVGPTMRPDELAYFVNEAHRLGMMVIVSTQLWGVPGPGRERLFESFEFVPADRKEFWDNYRKLLRSEIPKRLNLGVDFLSVGLNIHLVDSESGFEQVTDKQLCETIEVVRQLYPGPITCLGGSLWYRLGDTWNDDFKFWEKIDVLSTGMIHTERPLTHSTDPALEDLVTEWEWRIKEYFKPFHERYNKPLIAHENGCYSAKGSLPWGMFFDVLHDIDVKDLPVSTRDQKLHFHSFARAFKDEDWFYGPGFCCVDFSPSIGIGGINDRSWSFRAKPAERVIARYCNPEWTPPANRQDGSTEDWPQGALNLKDPEGDNIGQDDILSFAAYEDRRYIHFAVEYSKQPRGNFLIELDTTGDRNEDYYLSSFERELGFPMEIYLREPDYQNQSETKTLGVADTAIVGGLLEVRLNKLFIPEEYKSLSVGIVDHNADWSKVEDSVEGFHPVPFIPYENRGKSQD